MDRFGANRNMGFKPPQPVFADPDGLKYYVADYSASQSTYVSETEQVIYKGAPTILQEFYDKLNPRKLGLSNGHGRREGLPFGPWSSAHDENSRDHELKRGYQSPPRALGGHQYKGDKFSSIDQADHRFWNPARDHELKRGYQSPPRALGGHQYKGDGFSPRAQGLHQPRTYDHDLKKDDEYSPKVRVGQQPWGVIRDHGSKTGDGFSPKAHVQGGYNRRGSPRGTYEPMRGSPRARDHYDSPRHDQGKYHNRSDESDSDDHGHVSDDDDVVCEGGKCYRKEGTKLAHSYPKDNNKDPQLHKPGNDYITSPFKSSPRDDRPRYEQSNGSPHPPHIKTRPGSRQGMDLRNDQSPRDSPRFGAPHQPQYGSPQKEYQGRMETTGNGEARGRYDSTLPHGGVYAQKRYGRSVIDCKAAAEKYNGIYVPN